MTKDYPSSEQLKRQIDREQHSRQQLQQELGQENYRTELDKKKQAKDYSRTRGGKLLEELLLDQVVLRLDKWINPELATGSGIREFLTVYAKTQGLPMFDKDTSEPLLDADGNDQTIDLFDKEKAALIGLRILLNCCRLPIATMEEKKRNKKQGARPTLLSLEQEIGERFETELIVNYAQAHYPDGSFHKGLVTLILQDSYTDRAGAAQKDFNTRHKFQKRAEAGLLAEVFGWRPWSKTERITIGNRILKAITECVWELQEGSGDYSAIFELEERWESQRGNLRTQQFISLTEVGLHLADRADKQGELREFLDLPMLIKPLPHSKERSGGYLQVFNPAKRGTVKETWKANTALSDEHMAFQNKQQDVALRICRPIYDLMQKVLDQPFHNRAIGSFKGPVYVDEIVTIQYPYRLKELKGLMGHGEKFAKESDQALWDEIKDARKAQYREFYRLDKEVGQSMSRQTLDAANLCLSDEQFHIVVEDDFRGRFYCSSGPLNYQGQDHQKAILEFAEAAPVDHRTEHWMMLGMAGFMGLDKLSYADRISGFNALRHHVIASVQDPINCDWWHDKRNVEKSWQWMQVAIEWVRLFVDNDSDRTTRCRVPVDATCSGQQLSAGWTRSRATAEQVNLTTSDKPADIYGNVLKVANRELKGCNYDVITRRKSKYVEGATGTRPIVEEPILKRKLKALGATATKEWGAVRKGSKAILMVSQYGAGDKKRQQAFSEKTKLFWLKDEDQTFDLKESAAIYPFFKQGLKECCPAVDELLGFVKRVVKASLTREDSDGVILIPLSDGSVIRQQYPKLATDRIDLVHYGHKTRRQPVLEVPTDEPDIDKHLSSTTANLVHGGDSSALVYGLGGAAICFPFTTCHDSVSARPGADMDVLQDQLRKGLFEVFLRNPLEQFVTLNGLDLQEFAPPCFNDYDISEVLTAPYAYC